MTASGVVSQFVRREAKDSQRPLCLRGFPGGDPGWYWQTLEPGSTLIGKSGRLFRDIFYRKGAA